MIKVKSDWLLEGKIIHWTTAAYAIFVIKCGPCALFFFLSTHLHVFFFSVHVFLFINKAC